MTVPSAGVTLSNITEDSMLKTSGAQVVDLEEYRRRRAKASPSPAGALAAMSAPWMVARGPAYCVWYPFWCWVPVVG